jgi:glycosyl transferase family 87
MPAIAAVWALLFEVPRFLALVTVDPGVTDFRRFYAAAEVGLRFGWPHIYDVGRLREVSLPLGPGVGSDPFSLFYMNPPIVAWVLVPLTLLPLSAALAVWSALNVASFVAASRAVFQRGGFVWVATLLVSLAVWPSVFSLERGQMEPIVYGFAIASLVMAERGKQRWAGTFLALAMALKPQDVYLLPAIFVICGMFRAAAWWLLASTALLVLFVLNVGAEGIGTNLAVVSWSATADPSFIARPFIAPFGPDVSLLVGQGLIAVLSLGAAWRQRRSLRIAFAIGIIGTLASGVHLHVYDYVGLIVAAWLVISESAYSVPEIGWLGLGVVCAQVTAILITWPILVWQDVWIVLLGIRRPANGRQTIPSSQRASSDMRSGVHTGS